MGVLRRGQMQSVQPQLPEVGRLFKGGPKQEKTTRDGKKYLGYGEDLDHFRFVADDRLELLPSSSHIHLKAEVEARWKDLEQATAGWKSIPILLPYRSIESNFKWRNAVYDSGGRTIRSCNGEFCDRIPFDHKDATGKTKKVVLKGMYPCQMKDDDKECPAGCKAEAKLSMIIPALYPGLVILTTKSLIDVQTIQANLEGYSRFDLSRIPLRLCRSLRDASYTNEKGEFKKQEKWLIHVEVDPQYGHMALEAQQEQYRSELLGVPQQVSLPEASAYLLGSAPESPLSAEIVPPENNDDEHKRMFGRLAEALLLTGFTTDRAAEIGKSQKPTPVTLDKLTEATFIPLRNAIYAAWGSEQGAFNAPIHAWNSFKKILDAVDDVTNDGAVWLAWESHVRSKVATKVEEVADEF